MHNVNRGPEPNGLDDIRLLHTESWIKHRRLASGNPPSGRHWRKFHHVLRTAFHGLCGYCERQCRGEIDHFRPKSLRPDLVYCWLNWIFCCHDCNLSKGAQWPRGGYVDPCADRRSSWPEAYFTFDTRTGELIPQQGLGHNKYLTAIHTIVDLDLNGHHHLRERKFMIELIRVSLPAYSATLTVSNKIAFDLLASRQSPFSSLSRTLLSELGYSVP